MVDFFEYWFGSSTEERLLRLILANQLKMMAAQNIDAIREEKIMADFSKLEAEVKATRGAAESTRAFVAGLEAKIIELSAGMNDAEDQAKVEAFANDLAAIRSTLPQAIVANPEPSVPESGRSTGGIPRTE